MGIFWTMEFFIYISELWVVKIEEMYKIKKKYTQERYGQILDFPSFLSELWASEHMWVSFCVISSNYRDMNTKRGRGVGLFSVYTG